MYLALSSLGHTSYITPCSDNISEFYLRNKISTSYALVPLVYPKYLGLCNLPIFHCLLLSLECQVQLKKYNIVKYADVFQAVSVKE